MEVANNPRGASRDILLSPGSQTTPMVKENPHREKTKIAPGMLEPHRGHSKHTHCRVPHTHGSPAKGPPHTHMRHNSRITKSHYKNPAITNKSKETWRTKKKNPQNHLCSLLFPLFSQNPHLWFSLAQILILIFVQKWLVHLLATIATIFSLFVWPGVSSAEVSVGETVCCDLLCSGCNSRHSCTW